MRRVETGKSKFIGFTIRWTPEREEIINKFIELKWLERTTMSELLMKAIEEYVRHHGEGNPQLRLAPKPDARIPTRYMNPVLEKRRTLMRDLEDLIQANPGKTMQWILNVFSKQTGLRPATTKEYLRTLAVLGLIEVRGAKVYPR